MKKDNSTKLITRKKVKKVKDDGYCDDCTMCWVARFLEANDGKAPAPAELAAFIKSKKH